MTDDIVEPLRVLNHHAKKLAENESLHDLHRDALTRCENLTWQAADEIELLRAERDEARRSVCEMSIQLGGVFRRVGGKIVEVTTPEGCAEIMRWDCFKEETDEH